MNSKSNPWWIVLGIAVLTAEVLIGFQLYRRVEAAQRTNEAQPAQPRFMTKQFEKSAESLTRADLMACRNLDAPIQHGSDFTPQEFARALTGTWKRRLTMNGIPIPTDSNYYFDMSGPAGGTAMMFDQVNLSPEAVAAFAKAGAGVTSKAPLALENWTQSVESGLHPGAEQFLPSVSSAYWNVKLSPTKDSQGHSGVTIEMNGDYFGSSNQFPPGGLDFTERASFFKEGNTFVTLRPWIAPSSGYEATYSMDRVVVGADPMQAVQGPGVAQKTAITFVNCTYQFVDSYVKISDAPPRINGQTLEKAWAQLKAAGKLDRLSSPLSGKQPVPFH